MKLTGTTITPSPDCDNRVRVVGEVSYDDPSLSSEAYWFEFPTECADAISTTGNPWLMCLLPLAVTLGEPLELALPVDGVLYENARELVRIWKYWYPDLHVVDIEAEIGPVGLDGPPGKTVAFFSGGVDSFYTLLRHNDAKLATMHTRIDDLLWICGFDIPLSNEEAFERLEKDYAGIAQEMNARLITAYTNIRETQFRQVDWEDLGFGCALASVVLTLENMYNSAYIASGGLAPPDLHPAGSHPMMDTLFGTSHTRFIHDGVTETRWEKAEYVARSDAALRILHVCWVGRNDVNCGRCLKCVRTIVSLALAGVLDRCPTFGPDPLDLDRVRRLYVRGVSDPTYFEQIRSAAHNRGALEIAQALDACVRRSRRLNRWLPMLQAARRIPLVRRLTAKLEKQLLRDAG